MAAAAHNAALSDTQRTPRPASSGCRSAPTWPTAGCAARQAAAAAMRPVATRRRPPRPRPRPAVAAPCPRRQHAAGSAVIAAAAVGRRRRWPRSSGGRWRLRRRPGQIDPMGRMQLGVVVAEDVDQAEAVALVPVWWSARSRQAQLSSEMSVSMNSIMNRKMKPAATNECSRTKINRKAALDRNGHNPYSTPGNRNACTTRCAQSGAYM